MSSASSNQSFVRDGAGYEELYLSSCRDPDELSERSSSAASPSSKNEDMELTEPEEGSDDDDQRIKSVVGADGLREFVMLPEWTVHNFTSTIKEVPNTRPHPYTSALLVRKMLLRWSGRCRGV